MPEESSFDDDSRAEEDEEEQTPPSASDDQSAGFDSEAQEEGEELTVRREMVNEEDWDIPSPNPFLSPLAPPEKGGPTSYLPPPPSTDSYLPSAQPTPGGVSAFASSRLPPPPNSARFSANMRGLVASSNASSVPAPMAAPPPPQSRAPVYQPSAPAPMPTAEPVDAPTPPRIAVTAPAHSSMSSLRPTLPAMPQIPHPASDQPPASGPSTAPPFAMAGSMPPLFSESVEASIGAARRARMVKRLGVGGAVVAVLALGYVERERFSTPSAPAAIKQATAGIRATSSQDGIRLVVDGRERGLLPQDLRDLSPGEHTVLFDGGDRYASQKSTVTLAASEVRELAPVSLRVLRGAASFDVRSPGTTIALVSSDERRALSDWSRSVEVDNSKNWMLEANRPGYKTVRFPLVFDTQAAKTFVVSIDDPIDNAEPVATAAGAEPSAATVPASAGNKRRRRATLEGTARPSRPVAAVQAPQALAEGTCTLNINSIPPARIALDGRPMGTTPKLGISVNSGRHVVMFVGDSGQKTSTTTCRPGELKTVAVRLSQ